VTTLTRSPKTDLDAQFFVDLAFLKTTGLKNIQANDIIPGIRDHHLIRTLLQKAKTIIGNTEYLVRAFQKGLRGLFSFHL